MAAGAAGLLGRRLRRPAAVVLGGLAAIGALSGVAAIAEGHAVASPRGRLSDGLAVVERGKVTFSAVIHPHGRRTTAFFEYGLAARYREPRPSHVVYDMSTPVLHLAAGFHSYSVSGRASGLVPNAVYNLRLVASSSAGTVYSPNATFRTARDPAPPLPLIGVTVNVEPISGLVLIRPARQRPSLAREATRLVEGTYFRPLTEKHQLSMSSQLDARAGTLRLVAAGPERRQTQQVTLAGGLVSLAQSVQGPVPGLTTVTLLEGDFPGAPTYRSCASHLSADAPNADAPAARFGGAVLQTLRVRDENGSFRTAGRYSTATASTAGTVWDTIDRCDGTLTVVQRGMVVVANQVLGGTIAIHAGQQYLAQAP